MKINKLKFGLFCLFIISYSPLFSQSKKIIKLMNLAKQEMTDTNYLGAINHLNEVLEKDEINIDALFLRGICFDSLSQSTEAIQDYNKVIAFSSNIEVYKNRALLRYKTGEIFQGVLDLEKYCNYNPKDKEAYFAIADGYFYLMNYTKALFYLGKVIELDPYDTDAYILIGWIKFLNNDYGGSIVEYSKTLDINPKIISAYVNRGIAKQELQDYKGAISDFDKAILAYSDTSNINDNFKVIVILQRVSSVLVNYDYKMNISLLFVNRAIIKLKIKDYHGATEDCNKAIELNPKLIEAFNTRGNIKIETEDYNGALKDFNSALEINSQNHLPLFNRGRLKFKLGDITGACSDWRNALQSLENSELKDEINKLIIDTCN